MSEDEFEPISGKKTRNWPEVREWAGLAIALTALLVGVVSIWTTAQISGLEDYLRSEISRRNVELDVAVLDAKQLDERVQESTRRLEELRRMADRLSVSSNEAQIRLAGAQSRSIELLADQQGTRQALDSSRRSLVNISKEIAEKEDLLANYRRSEVYSEAIFTFSFRLDDEKIDGGGFGAYALNEMRNFGIGRNDDDKSALYQRVRTDGVALCRGLEKFAPTLPNEIETPKLGRPPGTPTGDGRHLMTIKQSEEWYQRQLAWKDAYDKAWGYNASIRKARSSASEYIREAMTHCACVSLRYKDGSCKTMPTEPNLVSLIESRPS